MRYSVAIGAFLVIVGSWSVADNGSQLKIEFANTSVVVTGVAPGADVVFFSVERDYLRWTPRVTRREHLDSDTDKDGRVTWDVKRAIPKNSIWAVVDLKTGDYSIAQKEGALRSLADFPGTPVASAVDGTIQTLQFVQEAVEGFLVRPGKGVWGFTAYANPASAADKNSKPTVNLDLSAAHVILNGSDKCDGLKKGDVVILVDPRLMRFYAARFDKAK